MMLGFSMSRLLSIILSSRSSASDLISLWSDFEASFFILIFISFLKESRNQEKKRIQKKYGYHMFVSECAAWPMWNIRRLAANRRQTGPATPIAWQQTCPRCHCKSRATSRTRSWSADLAYRSSWQIDWACRSSRTLCSWTRLHFWCRTRRDSSWWPWIYLRSIEYRCHRFFLQIKKYI